MSTQLYTITTLGQGRLSVMPKPDGDNLERDIAFYKKQGVTKVISLLLPEEIEKFALQPEADFCQQAGLRFTHFPIKDMSVPELNSLITLNQTLKNDLSAGHHLAIHCHGGRGRAGTVAISLMIEHGFDADHAMHLAQSARGDKMPVNDLQVEFVRNYKTAN